MDKKETSLLVDKMLKHLQRNKDQIIKILMKKSKKTIEYGKPTCVIPTDDEQFILKIDIQMLRKELDHYVFTRLKDR